MFKHFPRACALVVLASATLFAQSLSWTQWSKDPQHTGQINVTGQSLNRVLADVVYDPFVAQEMAPRW